MLPVSLTLTSTQAGCTACRKGENTTPRSTERMSPACDVSAGHLSLGRRSLEAVKSIRGTIKDRLALETATNSLQPSTAMSLIVNTSSSSPSVKQRWFDSLRSRASKIPTPTSPASMSSTLRRSRFFRSSEAPLQEDTIVSFGKSQSLPFKSPLPKLELPSFQSELQTSAIFRPRSAGKAACGTPMRCHMPIGSDHTS